MSQSDCAATLTKQPMTATRPAPPSFAESRGATTRANGRTINGPGAMASPASIAEKCHTPVKNSTMPNRKAPNPA